MTGRAVLPAGYRLAQAGLRDIVGIHNLERAAFPLDAYDYLMLANLLLWPGNVNLKALDPQGRLVGHVAGNPRPWLRRAWIVTLAVAPPHQSLGLGSALLSACEERLRPPNLRLTVRAGNEPAIALYTQVGYRQLRRMRRYYNGGEDGILMEKRRAR